ncbi:putative NDP-glucose--starch glucosyltransferase [Helianthus debilis subsp. tardiflorus]
MLCNDCHITLLPCYLKSMYQQRELYMSAKIYVLEKSGFWSESHNFMNLMLSALVQGKVESYSKLQAPASAQFRY